MTISEMQSFIEETAADSLLSREEEFERRMEAVDRVDFLVIDRLDELLLQEDQQDLLLLKHRAESIKQQLESIDAKMFRRLQARIRAGEVRGERFRELIREYTGFNAARQEAATEYDHVDVFMNGLFSFQTMPEQTKELEPDMVYYQKTPARIVFELVEKAGFTKEDVFYDIGAGLGQVAMLVHLLSGVPARGIEFEPAFCDYANNCAAQLHLANTAFINADARTACYSDGTVFFMFTPFKGQILQQVLNALEKESLQRKIRIITYGPCTAHVASQNWLQPLSPGNGNAYSMAVFSSIS
ncbi:class I SAM-dependent methyltransferase [Chitinophaga sp. OAE865]|uniref:class I SAM-dependent methyltransferase n=1 Tax=Chitinophaga sp. OAE865 TaxID=2817898 RepID=UPI001AE88605